MNRWWIYQRERFPLTAYGLLAATTGVAATINSSMLRGQYAWPAAGTVLAASASALAFFVQMRVADEFKDREDDALWRPERPVPRGLVRLAELAAIALVAATLQVTLACAFGAPMLVPLMATWAYFALTAVEFGAGNWLKARPAAYLLSHLPLPSLIVFQLSSFDWLATHAEMPAGLGALLATAFASALLLEVSRKLRAPSDEQPGVVTYTAAWGARRALTVWVSALVATLAAAGCAAGSVGAGLPFAAAALALCAAGVTGALHFVAAPSKARAARLDALARATTLLAYLGLGPAALAWALYGQ